MAANTAPIYVKAPDMQLAGAILGSAANTATDGSGANTFQIFVADPTNGSFVYSVTLKPISTILGTVARLWYCNDAGVFAPGTTNTVLNTAMLAELSIAAWTLSQTAASPQYEIPINKALPPSTKLLISFGTSTGAGTTGFNPITYAGKY